MVRDTDERPPALGSNSGPTAKIGLIVYDFRPAGKAVCVNLFMLRNPPCPDISGRREGFGDTNLKL